MFPRELWDIIYYGCDINTLDNLSLVNKQFYQELSSSRFWKLYTNFIEYVNYQTASEWIKEYRYIQYVYHLIDQLSKSSPYCQMVLKRGKDKGKVCNKIDCQHQDRHGVINKARIVIHLKHIDVKRISLIMPLDISAKDLIIYSYKLITLESNARQEYAGIITKKEFELLIYQIYKQIKI